uniref:Uncharacterized protein n=1 Tax=Anguilla anguilla TaxID=7936 RepID=A0A0E9T2Y0_ANGAN
MRVSQPVLLTDLERQQGEEGGRDRQRERKRGMKKRPPLPFPLLIISLHLQFA